MKKYASILAIIAGIGGLAAAGVGLACYFHVGTLSNMTQINAIIMMTAGFLSGTLLLTTGIHNVKNRKTHYKTQSIRSLNTLQSADASIETTSLMLDKSRFGQEHWETYFGKVEDEPPLPSNLEEILNSPCPFFGEKGKKVRDTHILVLIPATVSGHPLTLNYLNDLLQHPRQGNAAQFHDSYENSMIKEYHGNQAIKQSHWVLLTRDVLPRSKHMSYKDQKKLLGTPSLKEYSIPAAIEVAICSLMEFVSSGRHLYGSNPKTYTRCSESMKDWELGDMPVQATVGNFSSNSLNVGSCGLLGNSSTGIAALRRFY
ncbi:MAG: hypothetical protein JSR97_06565 [Verrucomicrobia bacterium]|nr:hypothetical protein [Verrucomicrobiota bacterium]